MSFGRPRSWGLIKPPVGSTLKDKRWTGAFMMNEGGLRFHNSAQNTRPSVALLSTRQPGRFGNSWQNSVANNDFIDIGREKLPAFNFPGAMTLLMWIYPLDVSAGLKALCCDASVGGGSSQWGLTINNTAAKITNLYNGANFGLVSATSFSINTWYQVAMTRDLSPTSGSWIHTLYVNGKIDAGPTTTTLDPDAQQGCAISAFGNTTLYAFCRYDHVLMGPFCATPSEIAQWYISPFSMFVAPGRRIMRTVSGSPPAGRMKVHPGMEGMSSRSDMTGNLRA